MGNNFEYVRVLSFDQNNDRQMMVMHRSGVLEKHIFIDKQPGNDFEHP